MSVEQADVVYDATPFCVAPEVSEGLLLHSSIPSIPVLPLLQPLIYTRHYWHHSLIASIVSLSLSLQFSLAPHLMILLFSIMFSMSASTVCRAINEWSVCCFI